MAWRLVHRTTHAQRDHSRILGLGHGFVVVLVSCGTRMVVVLVIIIIIMVVMAKRCQVIVAVVVVVTVTAQGDTVRSRGDKRGLFTKGMVTLE